MSIEGSTRPKNQNDLLLSLVFENFLSCVIHFLVNLYCKKEKAMGGSTRSHGSNISSEILKRKYL